MMKTKLADDSVCRILEATSYRSFVKLWMEEFGKIKKFGYSDIARRGASRQEAFRVSHPKRKHVTFLASRI
jgi:hypothetical protein